MNEKLLQQLQDEQERGDKLLEKFYVLSSVQGRLKAVIKHHRIEQVVEFAGDLLDMIENELETIDKKHRNNF